MRFKSILTGLGASAILTAFAWAQPFYAAQPIGPPSGALGVAWAVNNAGIVVGEYEDGQTLPFRWDESNGAVMLPPLAGHVGGGAYGINQQGQIVGWAWDGTKRQAVLWSSPGQAPILLGWGGQNAAGADAINDAGVIVGDDGAGHSYRYTPGGGAVPLTPLTGLPASNALAINNFGEIAGVSFVNFFGGTPIDPAPTTIWTAAGVPSCPPCTAADPNLCQSSPGPGRGCVLSFGATINDNDVLCMSTDAGLVIRKDGTVLLQAGLAASGASLSGTIALAANSNQGGGLVRAFVASGAAQVELQTGGLDATYPNAISPNGIVVGQGSYTSGPKNSTALVWFPSSLTCPGDVNNDHQVDLSDVVILLANFGVGATYAQGDLTGDGIIDLSDLSLVLSRYGLACH